MVRIKFGRQLVFISLLLFAVGGITVTAKILSSPQHGTPAKLGTLNKTRSGTDSSEALPPTTTDQQYFSIALPSGYSIQNSGQAAGPLLFSQTIIKPSNQGSIIITIGIQQMPEGGLAEDASFRLRQSNTSRYMISQDTVQGEPVTISNDLQNANVVAFWPHGPYIATISAAQGVDNPSSNDNASIKKVLMTLLQGWTWK